MTGSQDRHVVTSVHASHAWEPRGNGDDGKRRFVCSTCSVGATWPEAEKPCGAAFVDGRCRRVVPLTADRIARITPPPPKPHELYAGPYTTEQRTCGRCGVSYLRPLRMGQTRYCGPTCSLEATREVRRRSGLKTRPPETREQKDARLARQRVRRAEAGAAT